MLKITDIFNFSTINIFADASILPLEYESVGCPGIVVVADVFDKLNNRANHIALNTKSYLVRNSTNNKSEIKAIHLGVSEALKYHKIYDINLFSDSFICINGLKEWIFSWVNNTRNGTMYNSSNQEVANQSVIKSIVNTILNNNLKINLYHQKGHVNVNNHDSLINAREVFIRSNHINDNVDMELIKLISNYNNYIDEYTRNMLEMSIQFIENNKLEKDLLKPVDFSIDKNRINSYSKLIGGN